MERFAVFVVRHLHVLEWMLVANMLNCKELPKDAHCINSPRAISHSKSRKRAASLRHSETMPEEGNESLLTLVGCAITELIKETKASPAH